jgi:DHA1 family bicyclomycin/chloramphenicol resistance-like MFS transporter
LLVTQVFSWRAIFVILAVYACLLSLVIFSRLPETRQLSSDRISAARRYWLVLRKPRALAYLLSVGCVYGSLFAYVTASPWLYIEYFAVNEKLYPLIFGAIVVSLIVMNRLNILFLRRLEPGRLLMIGKLGQCVLSFGLVCYVVWVDELTVLGMTLMVMAVLCWHGMLVANSMASITELFPDNSATATALMGGFGFALASLTSALVGLLADGTPVPMAGIMFTCSTLGVLISLGQT